MIEALWTFLVGQVDNAVFSGGLALGLLGTAAAAASRLPALFRHLLDTQLTCSVMIDGRSELFDRVEAWLADHRYARRCRRLAASLREQEDGERVLLLSPGEGTHVFRHGRVLLWLKREAERGQGSTIVGLRQRKERIYLRALTRDLSYLQDLLRDIDRRYGDRNPNRLSVHVPSEHGQWMRVAHVAKRPITSLTLKDGLADDLLGDAKTFLGDQVRYATHGVPWRRGYLLHGPPGTGKTSLVRALAGALDLDLSVVSLASEQIDDLSLASILAEAPRCSILLFEDVDAVFRGRERSDAAPRLTFSGLLNALDGVIAQEGRILCMTTNHPELLDPALIRPGRIDRRFELGFVGVAQVVRMVEAHFPDHPDLPRRIAAIVGGHHLSPAAIQGALFTAGSDPDRLTDELRALVASQ